MPSTAATIPRAGRTESDCHEGLAYLADGVEGGLAERIPPFFRGAADHAFGYLFDKVLGKGKKQGGKKTPLLRMGKVSDAILVHVLTMLRWIFAE